MFGKKLKNRLKETLVKCERLQRDYDECTSNCQKLSSELQDMNISYAIKMDYYEICLNALETSLNHKDYFKHDEMLLITAGEYVLRRSLQESSLDNLCRSIKIIEELGLYVNYNLLQEAKNEVLNAENYYKQLMN